MLKPVSTAPGLRLAGALSLLLILWAGLAHAEGDIPRRPDGKPDLNGTWQVMNRANFNIEAHPAAAAMALREGPFGPVPAKAVVALGAVGAVPAGMGVVEGGPLPYKPEALKRRDENKANWLERDPEIKCYLPGLPRANYMAFPFQIFHSDKAVFFAYEFAGAVRNVFLEDPGPAPIDSWMGQSYGTWEGDTFVIEVTGQNDQTWFDRAGNHHSAQMRLTERFTLTSAHTLRYEAEIDDPETFTRPWTMSMTLYRRVGPDAVLQQFKCVEFVEELLYGHLRKEPLD